MPRSTMCGNKFQWFICPQGGEVMMEAKALLQCEISCSNCVLGKQYLMCVREYDSYTEHI